MKCISKIKKDLKTILRRFLNNRQLVRSRENDGLVMAHLEKAKHNMEFFSKNKDDSKYNDRLIVVLYYSLYHAALALVVNRAHSSKNHTATLLFLIKYYGITKEDAHLLRISP